MYPRLKKLVAPALLAVCFIIITAIVSQSEYSLTPVGRFCFLFHTIPFQIGFSDTGELYFVWIYYPILWLLLTLLFSWIGHLSRMAITTLKRS